MSDNITNQRKEILWNQQILVSLRFQLVRATINKDLF